MNKSCDLLWALSLLTLTCIAVDSKSISSGRVPLEIVNGTVAEEGEFPYEVQLLNRDSKFVCGGSIIGDKWILTAGHCVSGTHIVSVTYGTNVLSEGIYRINITILVEKVYLHPKFTMNFTGVGSVPVYDVGILELSDPIPFSKNVQPIKLAELDNIPFHVDGLLAGWGVNSTYESATQQYLQKLQLPLLTDAECSEKIAASANLNIYNALHNLCSDFNLNGPCYGDSGSPFVINGTQYGITSWMVPPCASSPACYSRISNPEYRSFIKNITGI